jgi:hypothetical protein
MPRRALLRDPGRVGAMSAALVMLTGIAERRAAGLSGVDADTARRTLAEVVDRAEALLAAM